MKYIFTILVALISLTCYCQQPSINQIVADISQSQIDSFSGRLDSSLVIDTSVSQTFYIDTIKLNSGQFVTYTLSVTAIQTNGSVISRTVYTGYASVNNVAGSYYLYYRPSLLYAGIPGMTIGAMLINNNTLCVVKVTLPLNKKIKIHYRRQEI